jgi:hypothetical protein
MIAERAFPKHLAATQAQPVETFLSTFDCVGFSTAVIHNRVENAWGQAYR